VYSQEYVFASNEADKTTSLYKMANESLNTGNTKQALDMFEQVVEFIEETGRAEELPENYLGMALSLALSGHYPESIRYHKKALRAHRKYKSSESPEEIKINLGLVYELAGKKRRSEKFLKS
jgi:tetratricopeptide (TPR) repeat protein